METIKIALFGFVTVMCLMIGGLFYYKTHTNIMELPLPLPPQHTQPKPESNQKLNEIQAKETIKADDLKDTVTWLTDSKREGRLSGTQGDKETTLYIKQKFESYGLSTEFQKFPISPQKISNGKIEGFSNNVIGTLPGKTPRIILIGGHIDHIGRAAQISLDNKKEIHPGADDNASGTASVLQLAKAFSLMQPMEHTIKFIAFNGEELGLIGSKYYVKNISSEEKEKIDLMVNFDMVGYLFSKDKITLTGVKQIIEISQIVSKLSELYPFKVIPGGGDSGGSDHAPFGNAGIPYAFFFTGVEDNYHRITDTPEKLDYTGQSNITKFAFDMLCEFDKQRLVRTASIRYPHMNEDNNRDHGIGIEFPEE